MFDSIVNMVEKAVDDSKPEVIPNSIKMTTPFQTTIQPASVTITSTSVQPIKMADVYEKPVDKVKTIEQLVEEVLVGMHGSGRERMISLGSQYEAVQQEVNRRMREDGSK